MTEMRWHRLTVGVALGLAAALVLSACSVRKHYGVATALIAGKGNCDSSRQVEVGAALDLSGSQGALGKEYLRGIQMGISEVNHSDGILKNHSCLELLYKNTEGNLNIADQAVLDLVNDEVVTFLIGPFGSSEVQATGADLGLSGIPTTSFSSLDTTTVRNSYPQLFPVVATQAVSADAAASYAHSKKLTQVAVIGEDNPAGREGVSQFARRAARDGLTLTGKADGSNYLADLRSLQSGEPQLLFVAGDDLGLGTILKDRQSLGWNVPVLADEVAATSPVIQELGPGGTAGVAVITPSALVVSGSNGTPSNPDVVGFLHTLRAQVGSALVGSAAPYGEGADAVELFAYVANSIDATKPGDVRTFIENANYEGLMASYGYTSTYHQGVNTAQLSVAPLSDLSGGLFHT